MSRRVALFLVAATACLPAAFLFAADEKFACRIDNLANGGFSTPDFAPQILVTGNEQLRQVDFTRLHQFKTICVLRPAYYGGYYGTNWTNQNLRHDGPKACWLDGPNRLTVAGVLESGLPNWTYLTLEGSTRWYRVIGEGCMETDNAVLLCSDGSCGFLNRTDMNGSM